MNATFPELVAWHQADPQVRYSELHCYAGMASALGTYTPGLTLRLYELRTDGTTTTRHSVTERGTLEDAHMVLTRALARWQAGLFDDVTQPTFEASLRPAEDAQQAPDEGGDTP